jgi:prepilin-type N-terminal cleavage/methylation domain-containing protein
MFVNSRRGSRNAFTLIELLVVIAIIAILAAILFPVFAQARAKARQTTALSNMKQIGLAMMMYAQDYDNFMPGYSWPESYIIGAKLQPYIKNAGIFKDPASPYVMGAMQRKQRDNGFGDFMLPPSDACVGLPRSQYEGQADNKYYNDIYPPMDFFTNQSLWYWQGGICTGRYGGSHVSESFDTGKITSVSKCVMMIDYPPSNAPWPGASFWGQNFKGYHNEGSVVVHMDGHAKWYQYRKLYPQGVEDSGARTEWTYWGLNFGDPSVQQ